MATLSALHIYPIKSCAGINLSEAGISQLGLAMDRRWMLIDRDGRFLTQREHPLMATVKTALSEDALIVRAPDMPELRLPLEPSALAVSLSASIWDYPVQPLDCGEQVHDWFSSYFGADTRLVQFNPAEQRICSQKWTGDTVATTQFSDGFPLLVASEASLEDRKSTRLNSSHVSISYAVFCLKKKTRAVNRCCHHQTAQEEPNHSALAGRCPGVEGHRAGEGVGHDLFQYQQPVFFFNDTATTEIYTLSLHDALPILIKTVSSANNIEQLLLSVEGKAQLRLRRSEEHTSELQSRFDIVCRLLLEK